MHVATALSVGKNEDLKAHAEIVIEGKDARTQLWCVICIEQEMVMLFNYTHTLTHTHTQVKTPISIRATLPQEGGIGASMHRLLMGTRQKEDVWVRIARSC